MYKPYQSNTGFTLAELLIALSILGVIATFTIPKLITTQANGRYNASAKEVASMITAAHQLASKDGILSSSTTPGALSQYMNYVSVDTSSVIDDINGNTTTTCSATTVCLNLHAGGKLFLWNDSFTGTNTTNAIMFQFDPDGVNTDGTTNGPGKSVKFVLYYNGKLTTRADVLTGTVDSLGSYTPNTTADPSWFRW
jgi:prepilin-type N-terminal cleavage/methylation domain-containing protein